MTHLSKAKVFYCYVLLDPRKPGNYDYGPNAKFSHEPFYVGKGHGGRSESHVRAAKRNRQHSHKEARIRKIISEGHEVIVKRTRSLNTEAHAFKRERQLVSIIGRRVERTGPLTNLTDGGEGTAGYVFTKSDRLLLKKRCQERGLTRLIKYKGESLTLNDWGSRLGIKPHTIRCRILAGWSVKKALTPARERDDYSAITHDGLTMSLKEWAEHLDLKYSTIHLRMKKAYPIDQVLAQKVIVEKSQRKDALILTYKGRTQTLKTWAEETGVQYTTARARLLKGWSPAKVLAI